MEKRDTNWVIVLNHTSIVQAEPPTTPSTSGATPQGTQPAGGKPPN
jgi:hypothetical protein